MLTNSPVAKVSVPVKAILEGTGLVDDYFEVDHQRCSRATAHKVGSVPADPQLEAGFADRFDGGP